MFQYSFIILYLKTENIVSRRIDYNSCEVLTNFPNTRCLNNTPGGTCSPSRPPVSAEQGPGSGASLGKQHTQHFHLLLSLIPCLEMKGLHSVAYSIHNCTYPPHI